MINALITIFNRDLEKLKTEISLFNEEDNLWITAGTVKNSSGNLCLHLLGNLNTYIGKNLGNTGYIRNREAEFTLKNVSKEELIQQIDKTKATINHTLNNIPSTGLEANYPENVLGYEMTTGYFLIHLAAHLSYHLGQINYLRRIL